MHAYPFSHGVAHLTHLQEMSFVQRNTFVDIEFAFISKQIYVVTSTSKYFFQTLGLGRNVTNLQNDLASQKTEIGNIKKGFQDLKNAVPLQTLNDMNNIILQIVSNQPVSPQQLTTLKNDLQTLQQRLQRLYLPPVPAG